MDRQIELRERFYRAWSQYVDKAGRLAGLLVIESPDVDQARALTASQMELRTAKQEYDEAEREYVTEIIDGLTGPAAVPPPIALGKAGGRQVRRRTDGAS